MLFNLGVLALVILGVLLCNKLEERDAKRDKQHRELMERLGRR